MLAKYLIAAGIVVADPNKVVAETETDAPYHALAVAPQRQAEGVVDSIAFGASDGGTITARSVMSGEVVAEWQAAGAVASLAYDPDQARLLVGMSDSGTVITYDLDAFLSVRGERGPPVAGLTIETGLAGVSEIDVPLDQPALLFRGPDGIVETERATGVELARSELVAGGVGDVPGTTGDAPSGPFVVATDLERNVVVVMDAATLLPDDDINGDPRVESLPSPAVGPIEVRGRGDDAQGLGARRAAPRRQRAPGGPRRHHRLRRARPGDRHGAAARHAVADRLAVGGQHHLHRRLRRIEPAAGGVDRPADRQRWHPERRLRGLRHDPAQRATAGHGLRRRTTTRTRTTRVCWCR